MLGFIQMAAFLIAGIFLYPTNLVLAQGGAIPEEVRRILWLEMWIVSIVLANIFSRWMITLKIINSNHGDAIINALLPVNHQKVYLTFLYHTLTIAVIVILCLMSSLNLFSIQKPLSYDPKTWIGLIIFTIAATRFKIVALQVTMIVDQASRPTYEKLGFTPTQPIVISTILVIAILFIVYQLFSGWAIH